MIKHVAKPQSSEFADAFNIYLREELATIGGERQYDRIAQNLQKTKERDPDFKFPELEILLTLRQDSKTASNAAFYALRETIASIVERNLRRRH